MYSNMSKELTTITENTLLDELDMSKYYHHNNMTKCVIFWNRYRSLLRLTFHFNDSSPRIITVWRNVNQNNYDDIRNTFMNICITQFGKMNVPIYMGEHLNNEFAGKQIIDDFTTYPQISGYYIYDIPDLRNSYNNNADMLISTIKNYVVNINKNSKPILIFHCIMTQCGIISDLLKIIYNYITNIYTIKNIDNIYSKLTFKS